MTFSRLRALKALYSLAMLVRDPNRLGEVFEVSDALATRESLMPIIDRISKDAIVARSFDECHRLRIDIPRLRDLAPGTLGREFAEHMVANNLDPSALPNLPSKDSFEYFRAHLYETHDVWHVATGFGTDLVGELGLQGFYLAQIPGPLPLMLVAIGFLRSAIYDGALTEPFMDALIRGYQMGKASSPLFGVRWDALWEIPLEDVRRQLGLAPSCTSVSLAA